MTITTHTTPARRTTRRTVALAAVIAAAIAALSSCSDGTSSASSGRSPDDSVVRPQPPTTTAHGDHADAGHVAAVVTVDGFDYGFANLPESVPAGTRLSLRNTATAELHEIAVFRLPDEVTEPLEELLQLPPDELGPILGEPRAVLLQVPGSDEVIAAVGDGVLTEPGRYAVMCFIPYGADPFEYLAKAAESEGGPPQGVAGGAPHFTYGMYAELEVTA